MREARAAGAASSAYGATCDVWDGILSRHRLRRLAGKTIACIAHRAICVGRREHDDPEDEQDDQRQAPLAAEKQRSATH